MNQIFIPRSLYRICPHTGRHELVIYFSFRSPFTVSADTKESLMTMVDELFAPTEYTHNFSTLTDYNRSVATCNEDTQVIFLAELQAA